MSELKEKDLIVNIQRMYYLQLALDMHMEWIKPYVNKDFRKKINDARHKNNIVINQIKGNLKPEDAQSVENISEIILDEIWEKIKGDKEEKERLFSCDEVYKIALDIMNLGMTLKQDQLNRLTDKSGKDVLSEYMTKIINGN
jgi:hypothetical protein